MEEILKEIFDVVNKDCRMELTKPAKEKITNIIKENLVTRSRVDAMIINNPNDMDLGYSVRNFL